MNKSLHYQYNNTEVQIVKKVLSCPVFSFYPHSWWIVGHIPLVSSLVFKNIHQHFWYAKTVWHK